MGIWNSGIFRAWVVASALWIVGMGWYQEDQAQQAQDKGITIQFSKDSQLHIDSSGIQEKEDLDKVKEKRLAMVFVPPLALLILLPLLGWVRKGFKQPS